jgi:hypothetical protein
MNAYSGVLWQRPMARRLLIVVVVVAVVALTVTQAAWAVLPRSFTPPQTPPTPPGVPIPYPNF